MSKIACDKRYGCKERHNCGGARPHSDLGCEQCPMDKTARCEPVVIMPKALTAENGAKMYMMGEFNEEITLSCPECDGSGVAYSDDVDEEYGDVEVVCEICAGAGEYVQVVPVSWTTIKEIYAMAVNRLGRDL